MTSYESIIGEALFSGDHETGLARTTVKLAVQHHICCRHCGDVLDQSSTTVVEDKNETLLTVCCPECQPALDETLRELLDEKKTTLFRVLTWEGLEVIK